MTRVSDLERKQLRHALVTGRFRLQVGALVFRIASRVPEFMPAFTQLYAHYPCDPDGGEFDFDVSVDAPSIMRRWFRRNATFRFSGDEPFLPMTADHAHALFEWGTNWVVGAYGHQYLILHSAVLERDGRGAMFVAVSGGGKSTLAAELALSGWRLLSDEMALVDGPDPLLVPHPRPVSLKNQSIGVIRSRHPGAVMGPPAIDTHKGTIAHLRAPDDAVERATEAVRPAIIVFPKWSPTAALRVTEVGQGNAAMRLIEQSFNYPVLGPAGFERLSALVRAAPAWEVEYSSLDDAKRVLNELLTGAC
jgi:HprK-related kinase A